MNSRSRASRALTSLGTRLVAVASISSLMFVGLVAAPDSRPKVDSVSIDLARGAIRGPGWSETINQNEPFQLAGFRWRGREEGAVEIRVNDGEGWGEWSELHGNPDEGPDPGSAESTPFTSAGPVWVGRDVNSIQVRVIEGKLSGLEMVAVRSEVSFDRRPSASAMPAQPAIITRAQWGADESWRTYASGCDGNPDYASSLKNSFVHHTVNTNTYSMEEAAAIVRGIYHFHTHSNGWCDIGYNFLIDRFGRMYEGRYGGITKAVIGAHAGGFNTSSTGISLIGDHRTVSVPHESLKSLRTLLAWKLTYHGVDARAWIAVTSGGSTKFPEGTVVPLPTIAAHRDVSSTACPGDMAYKLLDGLRAEVQAEAMSSPPFPLPGWQAASSGPGLLVLDGYGGLHPAGRQGAVAPGGFWPRWLIARDAVITDAGGYVVDGYGGLHPFAGAPSMPNPAYWPGWDIVRGIARGPGTAAGWILDGYGGMHPFGGASLMPNHAYWPGRDIARGITTNSAGTGGYLLDGYGGVHAFGFAPPVISNSYWNGWDIARDIAIRPDGMSGYVLDGYGGVHPFGGAPTLPGNSYTGKDTARALVLTADGGGGWVVDKDGQVRTFGNAPLLKQSRTWTDLGVTRGAVLAPSVT